MRSGVSLFGNGFENHGHDIIIDNGFKLVADLLKENGDVFLEFTECMPVEGEKVVGRVVHLGIDTNAAVTVFENEAVHLLTVILPHDPSVWEHPLEELWELEPESLGFPDCKVTMSAISAGIRVMPMCSFSSSHQITCISPNRYSLKRFISIPPAPGAL